jgi:hypothetical protein
MLLRQISARKAEYMLIFFHKNSAHHPLPRSGDDLFDPPATSGFWSLPLSTQKL